MRCISVAVSGNDKAQVESVAADIAAKMRDSMQTYQLPTSVAFEDVSVIDPDADEPAEYADSGKDI